jgi:NAD dependent epimerase/dehydratase family enzyme
VKVLMTGATGLIGKELGKKLASEGHEITVISRSLA